jgi:formate C-acetyltransferase
MNNKFKTNPWQPVLALQRKLEEQEPMTYNLSLYWQGQAMQKYHGDPECLLRAKVFKHMLENVFTYFHEGELFCGSLRCFRISRLPENISESDFQKKLDVFQTKGRRNFTAGFDHSLADYQTLLTIGVGGVIARIEDSLNNKTAKKQVDFLNSMLICLKAFSAFITRYADAAEDVEQRKILRKISVSPPENLIEAMQLVWLTNIVFSMEGRSHMALGRIDQYLYPFYCRDIESGWLSHDDALNLFCHLWVKIEELHEVSNICIGGLTPAGEDATNELSYIALEATRLVCSPSTNLSARFHDSSPEKFHLACAEVIRTGIGFPAIFNDHVLLPGLEKQGIPAEIARNYCMVGCIETMLPGQQPAWSDSRFNILLCFTKALQKMRESKARNFKKLMKLFYDIMLEDLSEHVSKINQHIAQFPPEKFPDPFLSALTQDCIERGLDINDGGALFPRFHGIGGTGLGSAVDSIAAVKKLVFEKKSVSYDLLMEALDDDFRNNEVLRLKLQNSAPKYGNADPFADSIAVELVSFFTNACLKFQMPCGGRFMACMASNVQNIEVGKEVGASPDGRHAFTPVSDAASPFFGRDRLGPLAFLVSVASPDYTNALGGTVINMKFDPENFTGEAGLKNFSSISKYFLQNRIQELQFNFTGNDTLIKARENPDVYRNLVVRVSGFSAYFINLDKDVQDDIIRRRAHSL